MYINVWIVVTRNNLILHFLPDHLTTLSDIYRQLLDED